MLPAAPGAVCTIRLFTCSPAILGRSMGRSTMKLPDFERAKQYALTRLEQELPASLLYHSVRHTRDGVVPAVERFAAWDGVDNDALLLLRTAAWYHDLGFVEQCTDHEAISVRVATSVLPHFGYTQAQIATIGAMIMATKLPQLPHTPLEEILADADLDVLGRSNFFERNNDLRAELAAYGTKLNDYEWYSDQLDFLRSHHYWTRGAQALRTEQKQRNIESLMHLLETCKSPIA